MFRNATVTEYFVAGAPAVYERDRDWEKVRISGPLAEDIKVYVSIFAIHLIFKWYIWLWQKTKHIKTSKTLKWIRLN